jgi:DNA-binding transcriptional LysR family regulator
VPKMADPFENLTWDDFRLVKAVADARGMPGASSRLGVNQSTVFRRLGQVEAAIGSTLFERHRAGYVLTPVGEEMVALARRFDTDITAFSRRIAGQEIAPEGDLLVTTNDSLLVHLLTPLFAKFQLTYPGMRLEIVVANQALNLSKRDADVAIRASDKPPENLVGRRVAKIAWALYGRASDFPNPRGIDPAKLAERRWVSLGDNLLSLKAARHVRQHVPMERNIYRVSAVLGLAEAVEAGIGIGHLPCFVADARPNLIRLASPEPELAADLWLLTHRDLRQSARVRALLDFLGSEIAKKKSFIEGAKPVSRRTSSSPRA